MERRLDRVFRRRFVKRVTNADGENKDTVDTDNAKGDEKTNDLRDDLLDGEANNRE